MKRLLLAGFALSALSYYVGCAPVEFARDTDCGSNCVNLNGTKEYRYEVIPNEGKVDILFVSDNSASMSYEQAQMAQRFDTFIETLDNNNIDYRIAITTTDIQSVDNGPRAVNQQGALQNGKLVHLGGGKYFISRANTPSQVNRIDLFKNAIKRPETLQCETFLNTNSNPSESAYNANCPSGDERGLYAAALTANNNYNDFIRADAHLAVVILSDEDVRSSLYQGYTQFALADQDQVNYLTGVVNQKYQGKSVRVHAIIVQPGDSSCLAAQNSQTNNVRGSYGYIYAQAAQATNGVVGDICATSYANQLVDIADNIGESIFEKALKCNNPKPIDAQTPMVSFVPVNANNTYVIAGDKIQFNPNLTVGTKAYLQYACQE